MQATMASPLSGAAVSATGRTPPCSARSRRGRGAYSAERSPCSGRSSRSSVKRSDSTRAVPVDELTDGHLAVAGPELLAGDPPHRPQRPRPGRVQVARRIVPKRSMPGTARRSLASRVAASSTVVSRVTSATCGRRPADGAGRGRSGRGVGPGGRRGRGGLRGRRRAADGPVGIGHRRIDGLGRLEPRWRRGRARPPAPADALDVADAPPVADRRRSSRTPRRAPAVPPSRRPAGAAGRRPSRPSRPSRRRRRASAWAACRRSSPVDPPRASLSMPGDVDAGQALDRRVRLGDGPGHVLDHVRRARRWTAPSAAGCCPSARRPPGRSPAASRGRSG